ncbi:MAG: hypothetical protein WCR67_04720 [Bacilli bacterium]
MTKRIKWGFNSFVLFLIALVAFASGTMGFYFSVLDFLPYLKLLIEGSIDISEAISELLSSINLIFSLIEIIGSIKILIKLKQGKINEFLFQLTIILYGEITPFIFPIISEVLTNYALNGVLSLDLVKISLLLILLILSSISFHFSKTHNYIGFTTITFLVSSLSLVFIYINHDFTAEVSLIEQIQFLLDITLNVLIFIISISCFIYYIKNPMLSAYIAREGEDSEIRKDLKNFQIIRVYSVREKNKAVSKALKIFGYLFSFSAVVASFIIINKNWDLLFSFDFSDILVDGSFSFLVFSYFILNYLLLYYALIGIAYGLYSIFILKSNMHGQFQIFFLMGGGAITLSVYILGVNIMSIVEEIKEMLNTHEYTLRPLSFLICYILSGVATFITSKVASNLRSGSNFHENTKKMAFASFIYSVSSILLTYLISDMIISSDLYYLLLPIEIYDAILVYFTIFYFAQIKFPFNEYTTCIRRKIDESQEIEEIRF